MDAAITFQSLRKVYDSTVAVDDLSLRIEKGEIFGLIGPNGAGKTTAVECALGLRQPDAGTVRVLGMDPQRVSPQRFFRRVGAQLQAAALPARLTVQEAVDLFASFYPTAEPREILLERWGLLDKHSTFFEDLSGGQKQRSSWPSPSCTNQSSSCSTKFRRDWTLTPVDKRALFSKRSGPRARRSFS